MTQSLCPVCAVSTDQVDRAVEPMAACPEVVSLDPRRLADLDSDIRRLGERLGLERRAAELLAELEERLDAVRTRVRDRERPRAVAIEWLEPPFVAGHWVPEMIAAAGGTDIMAAPGDASVRTDWARIHAADPEVLLVMPCGFDRDGATDQVAAPTQSLMLLSLGFPTLTSPRGRSCRGTVRRTSRSASVLRGSA